MRKTPADPIIAAPVDFERFYRSNRDSLVRALSLTLGNSDLGADAADEAMARTYQHWRKVSTYDKPEGWAYRVGLNWATSVPRRRRYPADNPAETSTEDRLHGDPDLERALVKLDSRFRAVIVLRYFLDWSIADTAIALGVSPGTVKSRLNRALHKLQQEMEGTS